MQEKRLRDFLKNNPVSSVEEKIIDEANFTQVNRPWGDDTIEILFPSRRKNIFKYLNSVILPERLTSVFHIKDNTLEVIYTAFKLRDHFYDSVAQRFTIQISGCQFECAFGRSSEELLEIAKYSKTISAPSETQFRNLTSFEMFMNKEKDGRFTISEPTSFFVKGFRCWNEEDCVNTLKHINFYTSFYDKGFPEIKIFSPKKEEEDFQDIRFIEEQFPMIINSRQLDQNLLSYWEGALHSDEFLSFITYYRIIEYASNQFTDSKTEREVRRELMKPSLAANSDEAIKRLNDIYRGYFNPKSHDNQKTINMIQDLVDQSAVWRIIDGSRSAFENSMELDGGFRIPALIAKGDNFERFKTRGMENLTNQVRKIRNALAHGKDDGSDGLIRPTRRNRIHLRPWVSLMRAVAGTIVTRV